MKQPEIKFTKVLRDCGHNADIQSGAQKGRLLYDYDVTIDGELRASFWADYFQRKYTLHSAGPMPEVLKDSGAGWNRQALTARKKDEFEPLIRGWLEKGLIPTISELADRKAAKEADAEKVAQKQRDYERIERLNRAAPDHAMIAAALCAGAARWEAYTSEFCIDGLRHGTHLDEFGVPEMTQGMRAAIIKALGKEGK